MCELCLDVAIPQLAYCEPGRRGTWPECSGFGKASGPRLGLGSALGGVGPRAQPTHAVVVPLDAHQLAAGVEEHSNPAAAGTKLGDRFTSGAQVPLLSRAARRPASRAASVLARCEMT